MVNENIFYLLPGLYSNKTIKKLIIRVYTGEKFRVEVIYKVCERCKKYVGKNNWLRGILKKKLIFLFRSFCIWYVF